MKMIINKWVKFKESISGTTDISPIGPNSPRQELKNTISSKDTTLIEGLDGEIYDLYKFQDLYNLYLKMGGKEDLADFNKQNLDKILHYLK